MVGRTSSTSAKVLLNKWPPPPPQPSRSPGGVYKTRQHVTGRPIAVTTTSRSKTQPQYGPHTAVVVVVVVSQAAELCKSCTRHTPIAARTPSDSEEAHMTVGVIDFIVKRIRKREWPYRDVVGRSLTGVVCTSETARSRGAGGGRTWSSGLLRSRVMGECSIITRPSGVSVCRFISFQIRLVEPSPKIVTSAYGPTRL